jgi:3-hydroxybutyryl-CoA dehydrogenase
MRIIKLQNFPSINKPIFAKTDLMTIIVIANVEQQEEIVSRNKSADVDFTFVQSISKFNADDGYDAAFYLNENLENIETKNFNGKPVFINSVVETLEQKKLPPNFSRINGWPGFLKRQIWEVAANDKNAVTTIFKSLNWNVVFVKDIPGLVAARVISMIINEAFYALAEGISTKEEIDLAMKMGTNYPCGPFEWLIKIGIGNVYHLLKVLSANDKRYIVSPLLEKNYFELVSQEKT